MGKIHDRLKTKDMKTGAVMPQTHNLAGSSVIKQLGLDTPMGMQRLISMVLNKLDPESKGVTLTMADLQHFVKTQTVDKRTNLLVYGMNDQILLRLCNDAEFRQHEAREKSKAVSPQ